MKTSQTNLFTILIIVVGIVGGYLYYAQVDITLELPASTVVQSKDDLTQFENININFSVLDDERFKNLRVQGESPVDAGQTGKRDIFAPAGR